MNIYLRHIMLVLVAVMLLAAGCNRVTDSGNNEPEIVACTMEALQCPDGSYVGRQGPSCEFAACPTAIAEPAPVPPKPTPVAPQTSGIVGIVTIGPTCPVQNEDSGSYCQDKPYEAVVQIKTVDGKTTIAQVKSDKDGMFKINLVPGAYLLMPVNAAVYPRASSQEVTVEKNKFTQVAIEYDSGIR